MLISDAQAAANRANAQRSTGPRTARGKANVRRNAHRHGLYAETAPDTGEDAAAFAVLLRRSARAFCARGRGRSRLGGAACVHLVAAEPRAGGRACGLCRARARFRPRRRSRRNPHRGRSARVVGRGASRRSISIRPSRASTGTRPTCNACTSARWTCSTPCKRCAPTAIPSPPPKPPRGAPRCPARPPGCGPKTKTTTIARPTADEDDRRRRTTRRPIPARRPSRIRCARAAAVPDQDAAAALDQDAAPPGRHARPGRPHRNPRHRPRPPRRRPRGARRRRSRRRPPVISPCVGRKTPGFPRRLALFRQRKKGSS